MRILLAALLSCGGSTQDVCDSKPADIGNCFSNVTVNTPAACGLPAASTMRIEGGACTKLCAAVGAGGTNFCAWDGKSTLRCEQCQK